MHGYEPVMTFGEAASRRYDDRPRGDEDAAVAFLAGLAGDGSALELAIGTGRIALPLAAQGVPVHGIDLSPHMLDRLREKPGGDRIPVTLGDFSRVPVEGRFRLIYLVYNTLFNLLTQDEQVRCFENVAAHLADDGRFVVEAFVPAYLHRLRDEQYVDAEAIAVDEVKLDVGRHDPVTQTLYESHVSLTAQGVRVHPIVCRYIWPSEMDLMARIAGLRLHERWGGWLREPFTAASRLHVSVYGR
ncbi:MAG: class I SAM-dependent methyltransferase [Chloroflexi bacterium]|nr:class I SAM-dependent methyltransferase [Chloroflexota bacterium]